MPTQVVGQRSLLVNAALAAQKSYTSDSSLLENPLRDKNATTELDPGQPLIAHLVLTLGFQVSSGNQDQDLSPAADGSSPSPR